MKRLDETNVVIHMKNVLKTSRVPNMRLFEFNLPKKKQINISFDKLNHQNEIFR